MVFPSAAINLKRKKFPRLGDKLLHPVRERVLKKVCLAVNVGGWLCLAPILIRICSLPRLLQFLTPVRGRQIRSNPLEMDQAVRIVIWVSHLRVFRLPIFPRLCLRQSLGLYRTLIRLGYPVEIHFGVHKNVKELRGHCWVTVQGKPVAERTPTETFKPVYSYSSVQFRSNSVEVNFH